MVMFKGYVYLGIIVLVRNLKHTSYISKMTHALAEKRAYIIPIVSTITYIVYRRVIVTRLRIRCMRLNLVLKLEYT